jgi:hypothetical protein
MSELPEHLGRLDDDAEQLERSSTVDGPAAAGEYDPAQGSPHSGTHPIFNEMTRGRLFRQAGQDPKG